VAKSIPNKIIEDILLIVKRFPQGASLEDILMELVSPPPKRSLQRYLAFLVREGRLNALGRARSRRYQFPFVESEKITPVILSSIIPLSSLALSIQANVRQPIQSRRPVGYNREFLDRYRPNETYYLPESMRDSNRFWARLRLLLIHLSNLFL
jgi:hypothetical protein